MQKISIRIPDRVHAAARASGLSMSEYIRSLLDNNPSPDYHLQRQLYILTRLTLLVISQHMPADEAMNNYQIIERDANEKFGRN